LKTYIYPQNLRASARLWLWNLKDFTVMVTAALISVLVLVNTRFIVPVAAVCLFGFMTIRLEETTILDFLRYAVKFFITTQQYYEWRFDN